jgi:hypothetical protein
LLLIKCVRLTILFTLEAAISAKGAAVGAVLPDRPQKGGNDGKQKTALLLDTESGSLV